MFGSEGGYIYPVRQQQLFERELPYKSLKIPLNKEKKRVLRYVQQKDEIEQLREQIYDKCKFQEMEYLEMLKKQREVMEEDIKRRKKMVQVKRMEEIIDQNRKKNQKAEQKVQDSLEKLRKEAEEKQKKEKQERVQSAYSSQMDSLNETYVKTVRPPSKKSINMLQQFQNQKQMKQIHTEEMKKEDEIQKIKNDLMDKYRFHGQAGKKPKQAQVIEDKSMIDWWVNKVRDQREKYKQIDKPPTPSQSSSSSDQSSEQMSSPRTPRRKKGRDKKR